MGRRIARASRGIARALNWLLTASPRRLVIAMGGLVIATAVAIGTGANFNATSVNPGSLITAGTIAVTDSLPGASILAVSPMKPGASSSATVNIANSGNVSATFSLAKANLVDVPASPQFSAKLTLVLQDLGDPACTTSCPTPVTMYSGPLGSMGTVALGIFAAAATHQYKFNVTFPDGGSGGADNAYGGASTKVDYRWTATQ
jgi:spore coat-associated protein N